ncbi:phosphoprotein phosphatase [Histomonas meleagridis]|uniref:phosphoprotein phosphatase n=1 Tax=Histomonas meleagridis TaxID=135588 RepID=UPI00355A390B|nr:phosphoprotein phosphatase [Histomonas meleagridis]
MRSLSVPLRLPFPQRKASLGRVISSCGSLPRKVYIFSPTKSKIPESPAPINYEATPFNVKTPIKKDDQPDLSDYKTIPAHLPPIDSSKFANVFSQKIRVCSYICDFSDDQADIDLKKLKKSYLEEIIALINSQALSSKNHEKGGTLSVSPIPDHPNSHLPLIYKVLALTYHVFGKYDDIFNFEFIRTLFQYLRSSNVKERKTVSTILEHYIFCSKQHKDLIYPMLIQELESSNYNSSPPFSIGVVLELFYHIFQRFIISNQEFSELFNEILRILRHPYFCMFSDEYRCLIDFLTDVSPNILPRVVSSIIQHWPMTDSNKETIFIYLTLDLIPKMKVKTLSPFINRIFSIYGHCTSSLSLQVSEAAIKLWTITKFENVIYEFSAQAITFMFEPILNASKEHWSKQIREYAEQVLRIMPRINPRAFRSKCSTNESNDNNELKKWALIARTASKNDRDINLGNKLSEITVIFSKDNIRDNKQRSVRRNSSSFPKQFTPTKPSTYAHRLCF